MKAFLVYILLIAVFAAAQESTIPKKVTDSETAIKIGVAALTHAFGKKHVDDQQPYQAELKDNTWIVMGTFHCPTEYCFGGAAVVKIDKADGHVVSIYQPK